MSRSFSDGLKAAYAKLEPEILKEFEKHDARASALEAMSKEDLLQEIYRLELRFHEATSALSYALRFLRPGHQDVYLELVELTNQDP